MTKGKKRPTTTQPTTAKRAKIIGTKKYIDAETGEEIYCQVADIEERDANFTKFWLGNILSAVEEISNAKMQIIWYLLRNMDYHSNILLKTIEQIAEESQVSKRTVIDTLAILERYDIIRRRPGVVLLNPEVMFKGGVGKRRAVLLRYMEIPHLAEGKIQKGVGGRG